MRISCHDIEQVFDHMKCCCTSCHEDDDFGYYSLPETYPRCKDGSKNWESKTYALTCCSVGQFMEKLTRDDWAKLIRHKRSK